ncbi:hypothetical protein [Cryobacterium aureum]|uniref:hypothetical protein n=1 Tax=Cryobacterium aureum TaxID=995037 RepID=UPI000CF40B3A|nr:hypothetical protein [Cryobacterium aureum]
MDEDARLAAARHVRNRVAWASLAAAALFAVLGVVLRQGALLALSAACSSAYLWTLLPVRSSPSQSKDDAHTQ